MSLEAEVSKRLKALKDRYPDPEDAEIIEAEILNLGLGFEDREQGLIKMLSEIQRYEKMWEA